MFRKYILNKFSRQVLTRQILSITISPTPTSEDRENERIRHQPATRLYIYSEHLRAEFCNTGIAGGLVLSGYLQLTPIVSGAATLVQLTNLLAN